MTKLKIDHLKLLAAASWDFRDMEYGAPAIDCKRPFGNSMGIENDMCHALGFKTCRVKDEDGEWVDGFSEEQEEYVKQLWSELTDLLPKIFRDHIKYLKEREKEQLNIPNDNTDEPYYK